MIPLPLSSSRVSTVPSNRCSPDHNTPILLASSVSAYIDHDTEHFQDVGGAGIWQLHTPSQSKRNT